MGVVTIHCRDEKWNLAEGNGLDEMVAKLVVHDAVNYKVGAGVEGNPEIADDGGVPKPPRLTGFLLPKRLHGDNGFVKVETNSEAITY